MLALVPYYLPSFKSGGPVRSLANLVEALAEDFEFRVICRDRDDGDFIPHPGIVPSRWVRVGEAQVCYLPPSELSPWGVARRLVEIPYDLLYLNSFFDPTFAIGPMFAHRLGILGQRPALVAPRGEFSPGALAIKRWKKTPYLALARTLGYRRNVGFHATSAGEVSDIRREVPAIPRIFLAANVSTAVTSSQRNAGPASKKLPGEISIVYLSRISAKKNLLGAIRIVSKLRCGVTLDIFGPVGDLSYWAECQTRMASLPENVTVRYCGAVPNERVPEVIRPYHVFLLPTRGENFGHAIFEALANGVPVVISDQTPWRSLEERGVGFALALEDEQGFLDALSYYATLNDEAMEATRIACTRYAGECGGSSEAVSATREMFDSMLVHSAG